LICASIYGTIYTFLICGVSQKDRIMLVGFPYLYIKSDVEKLKRKAMENSKV